MATTLFWRPSPLARACAPSTPVIAAQAHGLGQPAVAVRVRTAPIFGLNPADGGALKINNYIGTAAAAAAADGATTSLVISAAAERIQQVQGDMVKGGDARGIPPRGTPV